MLYKLLAKNAKFWVTFHRSNSIYTFYCIVHVKEVIDVQATQIMRCILCHIIASSNVFFHAPTVALTIAKG
jgi:hypothetical protein